MAGGQILLTPAEWKIMVMLTTCEAASLVKPESDTQTVNLREEHPANEMHIYFVKGKKCMQVQMLSSVSRIMQMWLVFSQLALQ